jgi:hypothetical protein
MSAIIRELVRGLVVGFVLLGAGVLVFAGHVSVSVAGERPFGSFDREFADPFD